MRRLQAADSPESALKTPRTPWDVLEPAHRRALARGWELGVPPAASAIHIRWWQLETWLRSLVYIELRARYGKGWAEHLSPKVRRDSARDQSRHTYMSTPDATSYLAALDVSELFTIIEDNWARFKPSIIGDQAAWLGKVAELKTIRHRTAHCRRPNPEDLDRLEQVLRDVEKGGLRSLVSLKDSWMPHGKLKDPLVTAWLGAKPLRREAYLIRHADSDSYTRFRLAPSRRPWARPHDDDLAISGTPGFLWQASWTGGRGELRLRDWWEDVEGSDWRDLIVYVCANTAGHLGVLFAAVDDPTAIADAIGQCFHSVLHYQGHGWPDIDEDWSQAYDDLDFRVQVVSHWAIAETGTMPDTIFGVEKP